LDSGKNDFSVDILTISVSRVSHLENSRKSDLDTTIQGLEVVGFVKTLK